MPFHVRVSTSEAGRRLDRTDEAFVFHVSADVVRERFVRPWLAGEEILCDGLLFAKAHTRLEIVEGSTHSSQPLSTRIDWEHVKREGRNVTDSFLRSQELTKPAIVAAAKNPARVMVVHGRDAAARNAMFAFLRALRLEPIEWSQAVRATGDGAPYNGQAVDAAFGLAQAALVLCTPDEHVLLRKDLRDSGDPSEERAAWQPRPNVYFEGGIAFTSHPSRTIVVEVGRVRVASDLLGRNVVRVTTQPVWRHDLAQRLERAGCLVDTTGSDWLSTGDFEHLDALRLGSDSSEGLVLGRQQSGVALRVRRDARHLNVELATIDQTVGLALSNGYWWNVALEGLPSAQWQASRHGLADHAPAVYDIVASVYVDADQMNKAANNHAQGGHDDYDDSIRDRLLALRDGVTAAQAALMEFADG